LSNNSYPKKLKKVLWFTNTPSLAANYTNEKVLIGGWIESLEAELSTITDLELGIAFKWSNTGGQQFKIGKTTYYPIKRNLSKNKIKNLINRWSPSINDAENIEQYLEIIKQFKPDIIHIFGTESNFGLIVSKTSIPCIIHIQGNLTVINHKWFSGISKSDVIRYSKKWNLVKGYGLFHTYFVYQLEAEREKDIFQECKLFMGRTDWDRRITLALSPGSKYFHCDEILRKEFYLKQWHPNDSKDYIILTTIRNNIYKGLETIFDCKKILTESMKEINIIWKVVGINADDEITYLIEQKYKDKFHKIDIHLLGSLQVNELLTEMLGANLFIHPSHIDNSPNSVCEAMILGMPLIASAAGGIPSLFVDKKEGLLIQDGDPYALAGAIIELITDRKYAAFLGENARVRAIERHDPDRITKNVLNIYSTILLNSKDL
jgi:glycosyltransferase involved in cell wall biosynthesis